LFLGADCLGYSNIALFVVGPIQPYQEAAFEVPSSARQIHEVPTATLAEIVRQIVSVEGPVHADERGQDQSAHRMVLWMVLG